MPAGSINPFSGIPTRETETVFRKPFTPEELKAILDAATDEDFIRPILVTGICTLMRRGDCCLLEWKDVDLEKRFITVKTAKTGQTVDIPIFPLLFDVLAGLATGAAGQGTKGHVFPKQARMYLDNPDGITWRVRQKFAQAGFRDTEAVRPSPEQVDAEVRLPTELIVDSQNGNNHLTPALSPNGGEGAEIAAVVHRGDIHADRKGGLRRASVRDFHSFRIPWVTPALTAGVPLELVQKVAGHKTTDIVLKHYFQPGREDFRQALQSAMPKLLTNGVLPDGPKSPKDEMREVIEKLTAKNLKASKARLLTLLEKV